jgi:hypothetical protein
VFYWVDSIDPQANLVIGLLCCNKKVEQIISEQQPFYETKKEVEGELVSDC